MPNDKLTNLVLPVLDESTGSIVNKNYDLEGGSADVSGKADKVTGATNGNLAGLNSEGNLTDSGKKASDFADSAKVPFALGIDGENNYGYIKNGTTEVVPFKSQSDIDRAVADAKQGTATTAVVLEGYTFTNESTSGLSGGMSNQGAKSTSLNCGQSYTIPQGYHNGLGSVSANSLASQTTAVDSGKTGIVASSVLSGYQGYFNGAKVSGSMANNAASTQNIDCGDSYTIPAGYHNGNGVVKGNSLASQTTAIGTGSTGIVASSVLNGYQGYYNGAVVTGSMPNKGSLTNSSVAAGNTVTGAAGYYSTVSIKAAALPSLTGNASASAVLASQTFYKDSYTKQTGTMTNGGAATAALNCGASFTGGAGYYTTVSISANSLASQTSAVDSGKTGIVASSVLSGYQGYYNGAKVTGSMVNNGSLTNASVAAGNTVTGAAGYYSTVSVKAAALPTLSGNAATSGVLASQTFYNSSYTKQTGTMTNKGAASTTVPSGQTYTNGAGYYTTVSISAEAKPTLSGNATTAQVLSGQTFYNNSYTKQTGGMANKSGWSASVSAGSTAATIPAGYHDGTKAVTVTKGVAKIGTTDKTWAANGSVALSAGQSLTVGEGAYYAGTITAAANPSLSGNAATSAVLASQTFYNNSYTKQTGTMTNQGAISCTLSAGTTKASISAGYHNGSGSVTVTKGVAKIGTTDKTWASGGTVALSAGQSLSVGAGVYYAGTITAAANPTLSGNAATSAVLASQTFYSNSYTKQTGTMTNMGSVSTEIAAGATYTGGAGYYTTVSVKAEALPTLSGNASASQVLSNQTFYNSSYTKQTGTMSNQGAIVTTVPAGSTYTIPKGYHNGSGKVVASGDDGTVLWSTDETASQNGTTVTLSQSIANFRLLRFKAKVRTVENIYWCTFITPEDFRAYPYSCQSTKATHGFAIKANPQGAAYLREIDYVSETQIRIGVAYRKGATSSTSTSYMPVFEIRGYHSY